MTGKFGIIMKNLRTGSHLFLILLSIFFAIHPYSFSNIRDSIENKFNPATGDLNLHPGYHQNDIHRLKIINQFLTDPLGSLSFPENQAAKFRKMLNAGFPAGNLALLDFKPYKIYDDFEALPLKYIESKAGINIDSALGMTETNLLRQYLSILFLSNDLLEEDILFSDIDKSYSFLIQADSILNPMGLEMGAGPKFINEIRQPDCCDNFFNNAANAKRSDIFNLAVSIYKRLLELNKLTISNSDIYSELKTGIIETAYGKVALGGPGDDTYKGNFVLIIDVGGNDTYIFSDSDKKSVLLNPVRMIIDLSGSDAYIGGDYSFGGAAFGINILLDYEGDDSYSAGNFSLGSGIMGFGLLMDFDGNDIYSSLSCSSGFGAFGFGLLIDEGGTDVYKSRSMAQGFGFTGGFGANVDFSGNDTYISTGPKNRKSGEAGHLLSFCQGAASGYQNKASGGIGLLLDYSGNDNYISGLYSQGAAYWHSIGALCDLDGRDHYRAGAFSQAAAGRSSIALLIDKSGNDMFFSDGFAQGCSVDLSFSGFIDESGDDQYHSAINSTGYTSQYSFSVFSDQIGNNSFSDIKYYSEFPAPMFCNINIPGFRLVHTKPNTAPADANIISNAKELYKYFDPVFTVSCIANCPAGKNHTSPETYREFSEYISEIKYGNSPVQNNFNFRDRLSNDQLKNFLATSEGYEVELLYDIARKGLFKSIDSSGTILNDLINTNDFRVAANSLKILKLSGKDISSAKYEKLLTSDDYLLRLSGLSGLLGQDQDKFLKTMLGDEHHFVRANAYRFSNFNNGLANGLADSSYIVRTTVLNNILKQESINFEDFKSVVTLSGNQAETDAVYKSINKIKVSSSLKKKLPEYFISLVANVRRKIYFCIINGNNKNLKMILNDMKKKKQDKLLEEMID